MPRRLDIIFPIVLFAIVVQLLAPIAAFRAFAYATNDPVYMAKICSDVTTANANADPSKKQRHNSDCCAFCAAGHVGVFAIDSPTPVFVSLQRQYQRISWLEATYSTPGIRVGSNAQARAPPIFS